MMVSNSLKSYVLLTATSVRADLNLAASMNGYITVSYIHRRFGEIPPLLIESRFNRQTIVPHVNLLSFDKNIRRTICINTIAIHSTKRYKFRIVTTPHR